MKYVLYFVKSIHNFAGKVLYFNLAGMLLISLFEGIGIFLLIPLISLTGMIDLQSNNIPVINNFNNIFKQLPESVSLSLVLFIYILIIIAQGYFQRNQTILNAKIQQGYMRYLREEMYKELVESNWGFFLKRRKSDIVNFMTSEINRVSGGAQMFLQFISALVFTGIQIIFSLWLSVKMTLAIILFGCALIFISRKFIKKSNAIGEETVQLGMTYLAGITDHFNGIKDIKSNNLEGTHFNWVQTVGQKLEKNVVEMVKVNTLSQFIFKAVSALLIATFVFTSIKMFQSQPAQLMLIIVIFTRLWPRFSGIQTNLEQIGATIPSLKNLIELKNECLREKEFKEKSSLRNFNIINGIDCKDISFRYNSAESAFALKGIDIFIPSKQMTAIVGKSGAGKSTLMDILMGLNQPETGEVFIDGELLSSENLRSFRRNISYVPQDPFLFNATVKENLLLLEPNASDEQIWEALEFSSAAAFVKKLPQGLDTLIGDRGVRLSGGERQRLVLARAILRKPSILFLDEATSALDTENEANIQDALDRLKGKMTVVVIAHRLSTIKNADQVLVLENGEVIQKGQFSHLANEKKGVFRNLLQKQMEISV